MPTNQLYKTNYLKEKGGEVPKTLNTTIAIVDIQLWQEFKAGNELAFSTIYKLHAAPLYSYGLKLITDSELVKDCIQDLFVELWDTKHRLGNVKSIKSYLFKCIRRKILVQVSKKRKNTNVDYELNNVEDTVPSVEKRLIEKQHFDFERATLQRVFKQLNTRQREIIHLKYYCRLSYNEISDIMSLDKKGIYNLMAHTLKLLKQQVTLFSKVTNTLF